MINKKSIWFLTLFSLILVLSVYYITMPSELLLTPEPKIEEPVVDIKEDNILLALKLEEDEKINKEIDDLKLILTSDKSIEDKNNAFNKIKKINNKKTDIEKLNNIIKKEFNLENFIKINNNQIDVIVKSEKYDVKIANKIIRRVQSEFKDEKYITIRFIK